MTDNYTDPLLLDWGQATVELSHPSKRVAVHVINHQLATQDDVVRNLRFICGRLRWFRRNLPQGFRQVVVIDDRGQSIADSIKLRFRKVCAGELAKVSFLSEGSDVV
jgi:hypothetical protein